MKLPGFIPIGSESLYSLVARHYWLSGHYSETEYLHALLGSRKARIHPYLPSGIEAMAATVELSHHELLYHHTLFPLFAMCLDHPAHLQSAMLELKGNAVMSAHLPHFKLCFFIGHKYCPLCVLRDFKKVGCGIWYIQHQIPGVTACAVHGCHLIGISNQDTAIDRHLFLPDCWDTVDTATETEIKLARYASSVLKLLAYQKNLSVDPITLYRRTLFENGFLSKRGRLYFDQVVTSLSDYWRGLEFGTALGLPVDLKSWKFVGPMLRRKTGYPTHVTKHLLLSAWLFEDDADRFIKALCNENKLNRRNRRFSLDGQQIIAARSSSLSKDSCDGLRVQNALETLNQARIDHPEWKCKDIKAAHSSAYFRVYHHNKSLLDHVLPPRIVPHPPGKNWAQEDQRIVNEILTLGTVTHMSLSQIDRCINGRGFLRKSLAKLPKTRALLKRLGKLPNK